jgi:signal peptide peptidase SppA
MTTLPRILARVFDAPLAVEPGRAETLARVLAPRLVGQGVLPVPEIAADRADMAVMDGVARIAVHGTLVARGGFVDAASGLRSYEQIAADLEAALADPSVRAIVLDVDSPGGEMTGLVPLVRKLRAARAVKPVSAVAQDQALSAAYAIASAAGSLYASETAILGSIGVIVMHLDQSAMDEQLGLRWTPIIGGAHKADFSSHTPLSDGARARLQAVVDEAYAVLVHEVAANLGTSEAAIRATEARIMTAREAVASGFAVGISGEGGTGYHRSNTTRASAMDESEDQGRQVIDLDAVRAEAKAAAMEEVRKRVQEITDLCRLAGAEHRAAEFIAANVTVAEVRAALLAERASTPVLSPMRAEPQMVGGRSHAQRWAEAYAPLRHRGGRPIGQVM